MIETSVGGNWRFCGPRRYRNLADRFLVRARTGPPEKKPALRSIMTWIRSWFSPELREQAPSTRTSRMSHNSRNQTRGA